VFAWRAADAHQNSLGQMREDAHERRARALFVGEIQLGRVLRCVAGELLHEAFNAPPVENWFLRHANRAP
jgi:hypothetical protein